MRSEERDKEIKSYGRLMTRRKTIVMSGTSGKWKDKKKLKKGQH